jgi:hypothetical protein
MAEVRADAEQGEEQHTEEAAHRHGREHCRQRDERQAWSGAGAEARGKHRRQHHEHRENRREGIEADHAQRRSRQILLAAQVGPIGEHGAHADGKREERLRDRVDEGLRRDLAEIRYQDELQAALCAGQRDRARQQHQQDHKQRRHQNLVGGLDALGDAADHDQRGERHEQAGAGDWRQAAADETLEVLRQELGTGRVDGAAAHEEHVGQRPACDHDVERQDHEARENAHVAHQRPAPAAQRAEGSDRVPLRGAADDHFCHDQRQPEEQHDGQIDEDEGAAAVLAGDVGKAPDIAEADGRA